MCGIAGIFRRRGRGPADPDRLPAMADRLVHRGPDDFGYLLLDSATGDHRLTRHPTTARPDAPPDVLLASRRLAILDLTDHGRMPLADPAGELFLTYNGEVYNYLELRDELRRLGHDFRTDTDTEVILHAYRQWGDDCVTRFNGMWAFALWDQRRRRLLCSRDRFGVKPFYYLLTDDAFVFASEVKALLPVLPHRPRADDAMVHHFLINRRVCDGEATLFAGVKRLMPAHNLVVTAGGARFERYWDYDTVSHDYDAADPVATFRELFDDAVRLRLRSDVPTGVALSGGLDSTSVLASMRAHRPDERIHAFTAVFPGDRFDESRYAQAAADHFDADLHRVAYRGERFVDDLQQIIWHMDYPTLDYQTLPRHALMREAKQHVTVVLEGQGADEMLAGYDFRYFVPYVLDELAAAPTRCGALGRAWRACAAIYRAYGVWPFLSGAARLVPPLETLRRARKLPRRGFARDFIAAHGVAGLEPTPRATDNRLTDLMREEHGRTYLPMLLKFGDATCMASSVEGRVPFLDYRVVEFVFQLDSAHKMAAGVTKPLLREAMADRLPPVVLARRDKIGFQSPAADWIAAALDEQVRPLLLSQRCRERGYFDPRTLEQLLHRDRLRDFYASDAIFQALSIELWHRAYTDG